ncbi:dolichyl-phosphate beta-glucosyltransferase [Dimargaris verticillata]|uniref:dolichyl-phosphate beta-glucosyltransferase n=1 Tax=Dimargaris verticillata TaxID=2761393 RepID=A0A9W8B4P2_9FUNG|nr:dolichyl-phosphate beta-glucosyltransferase [Dimargaris verticillata]
MLKLLSPAKRAPTARELEYRDITSPQPKPVDSLYDPPSVTLSVVVPAYNECQRLPTMLKDAQTYLDARLSYGQQHRKGHNRSSSTTSLASPTAAEPCDSSSESSGSESTLLADAGSSDETLPGSPQSPGFASFSYEILVVDDGSRDETTQVALDYARKHRLNNLRVITFEHNRGKGGAVTQGFLHARGEYILFADADGATEFQDVGKLITRLDAITTKKMGIAVGSRSHLQGSDAVVKRSWLRTVLMRSFHAFVYVFGIREIEDTQCGFKLFTRRAAQAIFSNIHVERWIFDIEVLVLARMFGIPVTEVPVTWREIAGSKMSLMRDSIQMATDLLLLRLNYFCGVWKASTDWQQQCVIQAKLKALS